MGLLGIIFLSTLVSINAFDYCTISCGKKQHLMCKYPAGGGPDCEIYQRGLSAAEKELVLAEQNKVRQRVAKGEEKRGSQPPAADMMELTWNDELAQLAQRWADQCKEDGQSTCSVTKDRRYVGQNMFAIAVESMEMSNTAVLNYTVKYWNDGVKKFKSSLVQKFKVTDTFADTGHYSQMVWAKSRQVGCGLLHMENPTVIDFKVICNYQPGGNVPTAPVYKKGKACSACPKGTVCSKKYPGLCSKS